jgi:uncharacterized protein (DUF983 family)
VELRKAALRLLILSIGVSGVLAIVALVSGEFGNLQAKVLLSALATAGASICGMACGAAWDADRWRELAVAGIVVIVATLLLTLFNFWVEPEPIDLWMKCAGTGWLLGIATGHGCLLGMARADGLLARIRMASLGLGYLLAAGLALPLWEVSFTDNETYARWVGVIAVLMLMGSLSLPVAGRLRSLREQETPSVAAPIDQPTRTMCPACGHVQRADLGSVRCEKCGARYRVELEEAAPGD